MGEEHDSGLPDSRAPWERPIAHTGRVDRQDPDQPHRRHSAPEATSRRTEGRNRRAAQPGDSEQLTVADLRTLSERVRSVMANLPKQRKRVRCKAGKKRAE